MNQDRDTKFSDLTFTGKAGHIWEYYKPVIFGIILVIAIIIYIIVKLVSPEPETILNVTLVNANAFVEEDTLFEAFMEQEGFDTESQTVLVNAGLFLNTDPESMGQSDFASYQALMAQLMVGEIDILAGDEGIFERFGSSGGMKPVSDYLSKDTLEKYQDKVYTVKVSETGEDIPCGIWLPAENPMTKGGYYNGEILIGIPYSTERQELAVSALMYLLGE